MRHYCLDCGEELDFTPTKDSGFCSVECEDSWNETGGIGVTISQDRLRKGNKDIKQEYPTRCKIIDVGDNTYRKTPDASKPYIGKCGIAELINGLVKITLDDGDIVWGHECWWIPI